MLFSQQMIAGRRVLLRRAERRGKTPKKQWTNNQTSFSEILVILLSVTVTMILIAIDVDLFQALLLAIPAMLALYLTLIGVRGLLRMRRQAELFQMASSGNASEAISRIRRQLETKTDSPDLWRTLATTQFAAQQWNEMLISLEQAERFGSGYDSSLARDRGLALWKLNRLDESFHAFEEVCRQAPDDLLAAGYCCQVAVDVGDLTKAKAYLEATETLYQKNRKCVLIGRDSVDILLNDCRSAVRTMG